MVHKKGRRNPSRASTPRGAAIERVKKRDEKQAVRNKAEADRRRNERVAAGQISGDPISQARKDRFQIQGDPVRKDGRVFRTGKRVSERDFRILRDAVQGQPPLEEQPEEKPGVIEETTEERKGLFKTAFEAATAPLTTKAGGEISQIEALQFLPIGRVGSFASIAKTTTTKLLTHTPQPGMRLGLTKLSGKASNIIKGDFQVVDSFIRVKNNAKNYRLKVSLLGRLASQAKNPSVILAILGTTLFTSLFWAPNEKGDALLTLTITQAAALRNGDFESVEEIDELIQETLDISASIPVIGFLKSELAKFKAAALASEVSMKEADKIRKEQESEQAQVSGTDFAANLEKAELKGGGTNE